MRSFWECSQCKEEYKKKAIYLRIIAEVAQALDDQEAKHIKEHVNQNEL